MPTGWRSEYLGENQFLHRKQVACTPLGPAYLDVISKVVPKICALTNSAMLANCCPDCEGNFWTEVEGCRGGEGLLGEKEGP
jgi:hypothetical protein